MCQLIFIIIKFEELFEIYYKMNYVNSFAFITFFVNRQITDHEFLLSEETSIYRRIWDWRNFHWQHDCWTHYFRQASRVKAFDRSSFNQIRHNKNEEKEWRKTSMKINIHSADLRTHEKKKSFFHEKIFRIALILRDKQSFCDRESHSTNSKESLKACDNSFS